MWVLFERSRGCLPVQEWRAHSIAGPLPARITADSGEFVMWHRVILAFATLILNGCLALSDYIIGYEHPAPTGWLAPSETQLRAQLEEALLPLGFELTVREADHRTLIYEKPKNEAGRFDDLDGWRSRIVVYVHFDTGTVNIWDHGRLRESAYFARLRETIEPVIRRIYGTEPVISRGVQNWLS